LKLITAEALAFRGLILGGPGRAARFPCPDGGTSWPASANLAMPGVKRLPRGMAAITVTGTAVGGTGRRPPGPGG